MWKMIYHYVLRAFFLQNLSYPISYISVDNTSRFTDLQTLCNQMFYFLGLNYLNCNCRRDINVIEIVTREGYTCYYISSTKMYQKIPTLCINEDFYFRWNTIHFVSWTYILVLYISPNYLIVRPCVFFIGFLANMKYVNLMEAHLDNLKSELQDWLTINRTKIDHFIGIFKWHASNLYYYYLIYIIIYVVSYLSNFSAHLYDGRKTINY